MPSQAAGNGSLSDRRLRHLLSVSNTAATEGVRSAKSMKHRSGRKPDSDQSTDRLPAVGFAKEGRQPAELEEQNRGKNINAVGPLGITDQVRKWLAHNHTMALRYTCDRKAVPNPFCRGTRAQRETDSAELQTGHRRP